jgi:hypothetical protein
LRWPVYLQLLWLAQVFQPTGDDEAFGHLAKDLGVLEDVPAQGAVAFADRLEAVQGAGRGRVQTV